MKRRSAMRDARILTVFIDRLNREQTPPAAKTPEQARLFAAARRVKSLKDPALPKEDFPERVVRNVSRKQRRSGKEGRAARLTAAAALLAALCLILFTALRDTNVVSAVERAVAAVEAYHGTVEVIMRNEAGETRIQSLLEVWADRQGNFVAEVLEGAYRDVTTVRKGDALWQSPGEGEAVLPFFSETYEFLFEPGPEAQALGSAESVETVGEETVAGRPAWVLRVTLRGGLAYTLWVDKASKIPLQKQGAMHNALQYTTRFVNFSVEKAIPPELLEVEDDPEFRKVDLILEEEPGPGPTGEEISFSPDVKVEPDLEIERADQIAADNGHSPWKLDPVFVAQVFVSLQISPEGVTGDYPVAYENLALIKQTDRYAKVEVRSDKTDITAVYLERLLRQDETGIWTVIGYDLSR